MQSQLSEVMSNSSRVLAIFGLPLESLDRVPVVTHKLLLLTSLPPSPSPPLPIIAGNTALSAHPDGIPLLPLFAALLGLSGVLLCSFGCCIFACFHHHRHRGRQLQRPDAGTIEKPTNEEDGSTRPAGLGEPPDWSDFVPTDAASASDLVFSTRKFLERKTSVYCSTEVSSSTAEEFSQLDKAERMRRRKAELSEGDECYSGATGTKDAPENPSGFKRTHGRLATTVPPAPPPPPPPRHNHLATTLPPQPRLYSLAAANLPPPSRRHSLDSTNPPRESGDVNCYRCCAGPASCRSSAVYI